MSMRIRTETRSALTGALSAALVVSKSALDRSLTLLLRERSKTATLNEHNYSVMAAILSDTSDGSDTNF